jgi:nicotinate-nucleotide adenylyltransferase
MRRIGLFGGTFDPPHVGHLALAEIARDRLRLDEVRFIPSGRPPHKRRGGLTPAARRLEMTRLAVRGNPAFTVSTVEIRRAGPSFTVETLRRVAAEDPPARLFLLMGADSLDDFASWRDPQAIRRMATLVVAVRPGSRAVRGAAARRRVVRLENPALAVSSSLVRSLVRAGRTVRYLVPDGVAAYIARHRLYRGRR